MSVAAMDREAFLAERKSGIGGTDAAAILGVSPWKTPLQCYAEKIGILEEPDLGDLERIEWGNRLEPILVEAYAARTGRSVVRDPRVSRMKDHPQLIAHVDARILDLSGERAGTGILEAKGVGEHAGRDWEDEPPLYYQVQLQHYLMVEDLTWGAFATLIGGQKFVYPEVDRNDEFCAILLRRELEFWDRVQRHDPPPIVAADKETLARLYPNHGLDDVALPAEAEQWDHEIALLKEQIKAAETAKDELECRIKAAIGSHQAGVLPAGQGKFTWKSQTRKSYVVPESTFRVLRRCK